MNNYSLLEKIFHRLALSSQLIREVSFDLESSLFNTENSDENHVFISGLARSGTTILLNAIYKSDLFASPTYSDMPFILAPNLWSKLSFQKNKLNWKERAHGDGIKFSIESPEAFEEVFWKTFHNSSPDTIDNFRTYVNNILYKYKKKRYLSKNNQNIKRLVFISEIFPQAKVLIPFRDPIQHSYSLLVQHKRFIKYAQNEKFISQYMKWIGHTEFGPNYSPIMRSDLIFKNDLEINHWIEQWYYTYKNLISQISNKKNVFFISYKKLCNSKKYWYEISKILDIKNTFDFTFKESIKEISLDINKELIKKAFSIYSDLNQISLLKNPR